MIIAGILAILALIYLGVLLFLYQHQEQILFHPKHFPKHYNFSYQWPFEEYFISPEPGVELNVLKFPVENSRGAILYFHGNRGHLGKSGSYYNRVAHFGYDVVLFDYRNYGKSNGTLSYKNLLSDGQFVFHWVAKQYGQENVIVHGCSLGSGIACYIASIEQPKQLVLETPYYSIANVAKHKYPFVPIGILNKFPLSNARFLPKVRCKTDIIHGTEDQTVPYSSAKALQKLNPLSTLHTIIGGGHSNLKEFADYRTALSKIYE